MSDPAEPIRVASLMKEIQADVRSKIRRRLIKHGMTAYEDAEIFERVRAMLQHAAEDRDIDALLLPELLHNDVDWAIDPLLKLSSHRPRTGRAILFVKRRILLPLTRWLFEYAQTNFLRQQRLNRVLISCIEELAVENAKLRRDLDRRQP